MNNNLIVRVTKAQKLEALKKFIPEDASVTFPGNDTKGSYVFSRDEMIAFLDNEIELLAKKNNNSNGEKSLTAVQKANEGFKASICEYLDNLETSDEKPGATCTEMFKNIPDMQPFSSQKVSALCRQLRADQKIDSKEVKGKVYFFTI